MDALLKMILPYVISAVVGGAIAYITGVAKLKGRIIDIEKWRVFIQEDTDNSLHERRLLLSSVLACLKGLKEKGCNGPVTQGIVELEAYINDKAHEPRSFTKEQQTNRS